MWGGNLKILYCLRRDAFDKKGGDSGKVLKYKSELESLGHIAEVITSPDSLHGIAFKPDLVHIFNMQAPYENHRYFRWAKEKGIPTVFSPIHHQQCYMAAYYRRNVLGKIFGYTGYLYASSLAKEILVYREVRNLKTYFLTPHQINREILSGCSMILTLSKSEEAHIKVDYGDVVEDKAMVVPNALTFASGVESGESDDKREIDVLVVGRIEPRKNQLKIAMALKSAGLSVLFVGEKNSNHISYFNKFMAVVSGDNRLRYVGGVEQAELRTIYGKASVCLSNSWFEVVSQVDLESISLGCKPIVSRASAIFDYFQGGVLSLDPLCDAKDIVDAVEQAMSDEYRPKLKDEYIQSWEGVAKAIDDAYSRLNI